MRVAMRIYLSVAMLLFISGCSYGATQLALSSAPAVAEAPPAVAEAGAPPAAAGPGLEVSRSSEAGQPLAARLNNAPIYLADYEQRVATLEQALALTTSSSPTIDRNHLRQQVLEQLLNEQLILQYARQTDIVVTDDQFQIHRRGLLAQLPPETSLNAWLVANDLTVAQFDELLRYEVLAAQVFEQVTRQTPHAAEQVKLAYLKTDNETQARALVDQLVQGRSLAEVVGQPSAAVQFEAARWRPRWSQELPADILKTAFLLQPGQFSGPLAAEGHYFIISVEDKAANQPLAIELLDMARQQQFAEWLAQQRSAATVEQFITIE